MNSMTELYRAEQFPVFQNRMFASPEEAQNCPRGDIVLSQDNTTGLIFNSNFQPELLVYDENYQNEQAVSERFQSHLDDVAALIRKYFTAPDIIEVGCGKGFFIQKLRNLGYHVTGLDPTYEGSDPTVIREFYGPELGLVAGGVVLRHVLEHIRNPFNFLELIRDSNNGGGLIYIEVPCLDWICARRAWFDVFYEHVNYFRLADFYRMFGKVQEAGHTFGGQYLYVIADLASLRQPVSTEGAYPFPADFRASIGSYRARHLPRPETRENASHNFPRRPAVVWGAASKGVIFSLLMQREGVTIDAIVDINPAKQGRYIPATGYRVWSPSEALQHFPAQTDVYAMNSNYLDEIRDLTHNRFNYTVPDEISI